VGVVVVRNSAISLTQITWEISQQVPTISPLDTAVFGDTVPMLRSDKSSMSVMDMADGMEGLTGLMD
jgi:hypothetical protein